jgi:hypothetical protein
MNEYLKTLLAEFYRALHMQAQPTPQPTRPTRPAIVEQTIEEEMKLVAEFY